VKRHENDSVCRKLQATSYKLQASRGFSLIEILVAVAIFSVVMVIAVGSLLTIIDANRKARSVESVMTNLNLALESMIRNARTGRSFHCETDTIPDLASIDSPQDCSGGGELFAFEGQHGTGGDPNDQIVFRFAENRIERSLDGGVNFIPLTSPEIIIDDLTFYVVGAESGDQVQPHMVVTIKGRAGTTERTETIFNIQSQATQRVIDI